MVPARRRPIDMTGASFHALLVGIDAYSRQPLYGCVNDLDAVQQLLLDRVGIPPDRIRRLASPHPDARPSTAIPAQPATLANLRAALVSLAEQASEGDRVFIYYSGHGTRARFERPDGRSFHREALVPIDFDAAREPLLLYDHELAQLLAQITARTRSVTVVLDCCHAAGVTRGPGTSTTARAIDLEAVLGRHAPLAAPADSEPDDRPARAFDDCHVVSACLHHEQSLEGNDGGWHGLFTRAFVDAVAGAADVAPHDLAWARIWQAVCAQVEDWNPAQHPWMGGSAARGVFAGPPVDGDAGHAVRLEGDTYELGAGALACVTAGAQVAVYGERPARFPPLGSEADLAARRGLLRVTHATAATATARAEGASFTPPPGARGRVVAAGKASRLRCAVVPADPRLTALLGASPLLEVVERARAQVRLVQAGDRWLLADDLHGESPVTALFALTEAQLDRARAVLEHYFRYALPLRLARAIEGPAVLDLRVLACPELISPAAAQEGDLPEAPTAGRAAYELADGARVCFRVRNTSGERLRVTLVNSAASGRVQPLGDEIIDARSAHVFWATPGTPFAMRIPDGRRQSIDRLTAIGRNALARSVDHLFVNDGFAQMVELTRSGKDIGGGMLPPERWTAAQVIVRTRGGQRPAP